MIPQCSSSRQTLSPIFAIMAVMWMCSSSMMLMSSSLVYGFSAPVTSTVAVGSRVSVRPPEKKKSMNNIMRPNYYYSRSSTPIQKTTMMMSSSSSSNDNNDGENNTPVEIVQSSLTTSQIQSIENSQPFLQKFKRYWNASKKNMNPQQLSKLGISALLSYGFVSNVSGVVAVSSAWFIFSKRTGVSPLAPGQKTSFLALYAGFTLFLNVIRPARFAFAMAISPYFEKMRKFFENKFQVGPRMATGLMVVLINLLGTSTLMVCGVGLASLASGVPVFAR